MQKANSIRISRGPKNSLEKRFWNSSFWPLLRFLGSRRKCFDMSPKDMTLATLKAVSGHILDLQIPNGKFDQNFIFQAALENPEKLAKILAISILNDPRVSSSKIENWLMRNLSTTDFAHAFFALRMNMPTEEFLEILSSVRTINILEDQDLEKDGGELSSSDQDRSGNQSGPSEN